VTDLWTGATALPRARERIFAWLAEGAREVSWALCSVPRERWTAQPPGDPNGWPALRHVWHLALRERHLTLPSVKLAINPCSSTPAHIGDLERLDATWADDAERLVREADVLLHGLSETRFELLQLLEAAPDAAWQAPPHRYPPSESSAAPLGLATLLLRARQHELEHLSEIWRVALYWDRVEPTVVWSVELPFHSADRLSQGVTLR
jgi:hypothetical protein